MLVENRVTRHRMVAPIVAGVTDHQLGLSGCHLGDLTGCYPVPRPLCVDPAFTLAVPFD